MTFPNNSRGVLSGFSASAATYEQRAQLQEKVAERLCSFLPARADPSGILEIGCGTGILTRRLIRRFPKAAIDALDLSARMIECARASLENIPKLTWYSGDFMAVNLAGSYPMVASSSALHWIRPFPAMAARIYDLLAPGGILLAAIMLRGTLAELRLARRYAARNKPPFTMLPAASAARDAFRHAGLRIERICVEPMEMLYPSAFAFLRSLNEQGLTADSGQQAGRVLLNRQELERLMIYYDCKFARSGGVYATYRVCYMVAGKLHRQTSTQKTRDNPIAPE